MKLQLVRILGYGAMLFSMWKQVHYSVVIAVASLFFVVEILIGMLLQVYSQICTLADAVKERLEADAFKDKIAQP